MAPLLVSLLTDGTADKATGWNLVFYVTIAFYLVAAVSFGLFASAELQPWAESKFQTMSSTVNNDQMIRKVPAN